MLGWIALQSATAALTDPLSGQGRSELRLVSPAALHVMLCSRCFACHALKRSMSQVAVSDGALRPGQAF